MVNMHVIYTDPFDEEDRVLEVTRPTAPHTWHSAHKAGEDWLEKTIGITLLAFGSVASVLIHIAWFWAWFGLNLNVNLLTNVVSLEAIFIGILMLIDGRNKDKQAASQALHFQETMDRLEKKIDAIIH